VIISLYNGTTEEQYEQLSDIAPVVLPTEEYADYAISWQEAVRVTGEALGRAEQAGQLVDDLEQRFADVAAENPDFAGLQTVIAERFEPGSSVVRASADPRGRFFEALGFEVPEDLDAQADEYGELLVSDELLDSLDRDLLIWNIGFAPEMRAEIEGLALWPTLEVVQQGRVLFVEDELISGAFTWSTVLSLDYALTELVPQLQSVVAGTD
jgi:iron-siderophore transport system substrate-binding protein